MNFNVSYLRPEYKPTSHSTYRGFAKHVDYNLDNITGYGYDYILKITEGIFLSQAASFGTYAKVDYILRVESEVYSCSVFECLKLIKKMDSYLSGRTITESPDKSFITHVRNKAFERLEVLRGNHRGK